MAAKGRGRNDLLKFWAFWEISSNQTKKHHVTERLVEWQGCLPLGACRPHHCWSEVVYKLAMWGYLFLALMWSLLAWGVTPNSRNLVVCIWVSEKWPQGLLPFGLPIWNSVISAIFASFLSFLYHLCHFCIISAIFVSFLSKFLLWHPVGGYLYLGGFIKQILYCVKVFVQCRVFQLNHPIQPFGCLISALCTLATVMRGEGERIAHSSIWLFEFQLFTNEWMNQMNNILANAQGWDA